MTKKLYFTYYVLWTLWEAREIRPHGPYSKSLRSPICLPIMSRMGPRVSEEE